MKNKISRLAILVPFFAILLMGFSSSVYIGLRNMMNTQGQYKYLEFEGGMKKYVTDFSSYTNVINNLGYTPIPNNAGTGTNNIFTSPTITGGTSTGGTGSGTTHWNPTLRGNITIEGTGLQWAGTSSNLYGGTHTEQMTSGNYHIIVPIGNNLTVQYGSESAKPINYRSLYGVGFIGTFSAAANPQLAWTGTLSASADTNRALQVDLWAITQLGGTTSVSLLINDVQAYPTGSATISVGQKTLMANWILENIGSTSALS